MQHVRRLKIIDEYHVSQSLTVEEYVNAMTRSREALTEPGAFHLMIELSFM